MKNILLLLKNIPLTIMVIIIILSIYIIERHSMQNKLEKCQAMLTKYKSEFELQQNILTQYELNESNLRMKYEENIKNIQHQYQQLTKEIMESSSQMTCDEKLKKINELYNNFLEPHY